MVLKVGINGFGRIGRSTLAAIIENNRKDIDVVAINATGPLETNAHLLKYDSIHGRFKNDVTLKDGMMDVGRGAIRMMSSYDPTTLDWGDVDIVMECSGQFNSKEGASVHLKRGAKRVLISAPGKNVDKTVVYGVNNESLTENDIIVSNASCTTNCLAPIAKILQNSFGIKKGYMTTIHAYTGDQTTHDRRHKDLYRARAATLSMIPTTTGAAKAVGEVLPHLKGKLSGSAIRVPTPNVSAIDLTFLSEVKASSEEINQAIKRASEQEMKDIIEYGDEPTVSIDYNHNSYSANFASLQTSVIGDDLVRVFAWYDNEWGFSCRMADTAVAMGKLI